MFNESDNIPSAHFIIGFLCLGLKYQAKVNNSFWYFFPFIPHQVFSNHGSKVGTIIARFEINSFLNTPLEKFQFFERFINRYFNRIRVTQLCIRAIVVTDIWDQLHADRSTQNWRIICIQNLFITLWCLHSERCSSEYGTPFFFFYLLFWNVKRRFVRKLKILSLLPFMKWNKLFFVSWDSNWVL